jgi:hypothetical protein
VATNEHEKCEPANNGEWDGGRDKEKRELGERSVLQPKCEDGANIFVLTRLSVAKNAREKVKSDVGLGKPGHSAVFKCHSGCVCGDAVTVTPVDHEIVSGTFESNTQKDRT